MTAARKSAAGASLAATLASSSKCSRIPSTSELHEQMLHAGCRADAVAVVALGRLARERLIGREAGVHTVQQLAGAHRVAELAHQFDASPLDLGRAGQSGDAGDLQVVDGGDDAVFARTHLETQPSQFRPLGIEAAPSLGADDGVYLRQRAARIENVA